MRFKGTFSDKTRFNNITNKSPRMANVCSLILIFISYFQITQTQQSKVATTICNLNLLHRQNGVVTDFARIFHVLPCTRYIAPLSTLSPPNFKPFSIREPNFKSTVKTLRIIVVMVVSLPYD